MNPAGIFQYMQGQSVSISIHNLHEGEIFCKRMEEMLECQNQQGEVCTILHSLYVSLSLSLSVLHSVVTHTAGVYQ